MALSLRVDDNLNGTVQLIAAGTTTGGTIRAARFTGRTEALAWADVVAFLGTSYDAAEAMAPGHYVWGLFEGTALSPAFYQPVSDAAAALATACRQAIIDRIKLLALSRIGDRVYEKANFNPTNISYPCVIVLPPEAAETPGADGGTNARSDWGHPSRVMIADRKNLDGAPEVLPPFEKWRQQVFRGFDREALPGVSVVMQTLVEPGPIVQPYVVGQADGYQIVASELTVRAIARQPRGFGT